MIVGLYVWNNAEELSFLIMFYIYIYAPQYNNTLISCILFSCLKFRMVLYVLHNTQALSFYTDVVLTLSIDVKWPEMQPLLNCIFVCENHIKLSLLNTIIWYNDLYYIISVLNMYF